MRKSCDSIDIILRLLEALGNPEEKYSVRKIEELTGVPKSTAHRILQELSDTGWVYQDAEDKNYYIGLKFLALANNWRTNLDIVKAVDPALWRIVERCRQTAFLSVIHNEKVVCLHKVESINKVRVTSIVGEEQPFHAGASSKTLLAFAPEALVKKVLSRKLEAFTPFTVTDPKLIKEELNAIRKAMYCESVEEMDPGVAAVSAHVEIAGIDTVMSLTIAGTRFDYEANRDLWLSVLMEEAESLRCGPDGRNSHGKIIDKERVDTV